MKIPIARLVVCLSCATGSWFLMSTINAQLRHDSNAVEQPGGETPAANASTEPSAPPAPVDFQDWYLAAQQRMQVWSPKVANASADAQLFWNGCSNSQLSTELLEQVIAELEQKSAVVRAMNAPSATPTAMAPGLRPEHTQAAALEADFQMQALLAGNYRLSDLGGIPTKLRTGVFDDWLLSSHLSFGARTLVVFRIEADAQPDLFALKTILFESMSDNRLATGVRSPAQAQTR